MVGPETDTGNKPFIADIIVYTLRVSSYSNSGVYTLNTYNNQGFWLTWNISICN